MLFSSVRIVGCSQPTILKSKISALKVQTFRAVGGAAAESCPHQASPPRRGWAEPGRDAVHWELAAAAAGTTSHCTSRTSRTSRTRQHQTAPDLTRQHQPHHQTAPPGSTRRHQTSPDSTSRTTRQHQTAPAAPPDSTRQHQTAPDLTRQHQAAESHRQRRARPELKRRRGPAGSAGGGRAGAGFTSETRDRWPTGLCPAGPGSCSPAG